MDNKEIFKRDKYEVNLSPVIEYLSQTSSVISKKFNLTKEESKQLIKKILKKSDIRNPTVTFKEKNKYGDMEIKKDKLTNYIKSSVDKGEVIVPSFTTYVHPSKEKSLHAEFLQININKRKKDKDNMFKYKQLGDMNKFIYYNTLQKTRKIFNNSLSGAYASKSTILHNPSAHYTLTSMTRSVSSIGNAITESFVAGNKLFLTPEVTYNYIAAIISQANINKLRFVIDKYNIYTPTPKETMDMVLYSSRLYWEDEVKEQSILELLEKCSPEELALITYTNDLHHMKQYNDELVRNMLSRISRKVPAGSRDPVKAIKTSSDGVANLAHIICNEELKGIKVDYEKLRDTELMEMLGATAENINKELRNFRDLIQTFFVSTIAPVNIANIKDCLRDAIVLSDTDSTCGAYDKWVEWYYGNIKFSNEAIALAGAVMTINTELMDHNIKLFAKNMNIADNLTDLLKMKNEFFWSVFISANVSKHYYANVIIQEGNVYGEPDLELKGVHFIASAVSRDVSKKAHNMLKEILHKLENNQTIDIADYVDRVIREEQNIIDTIRSGDINIYKKEKIKDKDSYKEKNPNKSPYFYHLLWKDLFADDYGYPGEPQYMVLKIPTIFKTPKIMKDYIANNQDLMFAKKLETIMHKYNKDKIGIFKVPIVIAGGRGIPKEVIDLIDIKKIVEDSLSSMYITLETIGIYRKDGMLFTEMNMLYKGDNNAEQ